VFAFLYVKAKYKKLRKQELSYASFFQENADASIFVAIQG